MSGKEVHNFETEVTEILNLMIHSLYSQREVFLRELISNASDAMDRLRFEEVTNKDIATGTDEKLIRLSVDEEKRTLSIIDNGIGMSREELVSHLGTIAYSGSKNFVSKLKAAQDQPELIGQFGVGFYASFMVADRVEVHSQRAGTDQGYLWESQGAGSYSIEEMPRPLGHGTTVTLHLKPISEEDEDFQDFTQEYALSNLVRKYSDFISYPIKMEVEKQEPKKDAEGKVIEGEFSTEIEDKTLNTQKALWTKPAKEISEEEYKEFYKHVTGDWQQPDFHIHYRAEGVQEFVSLLYIPSAVPWDYNNRDQKFGLSLYVRRVFILENCEQLIPNYLRFVKGIVDSDDLPLNVSREMIQEDRRLTAIRKALVSKILRTLSDLMTSDREKYLAFFERFGSTLKEGAAFDYANKDKILNLSMFASSTEEGKVSLSEYVARMQPGQKGIYYLTGESVESVKHSPLLEQLRSKKLEVLYMTDPVDEWVMKSCEKFQDHELISIAHGTLDLGESDKKDEEKALAEGARYKDLVEVMKTTLNSTIKEVRVSDRLVESPACLVSAGTDPSAYVERMMSQMGQKVEPSLRILEINPKHPVCEKMLTLPQAKQESWSKILYHQALLNEGSPIRDPSVFSKEISDLMLAH